MSAAVPIVLHPAGITREVAPGTPLREFLFDHGVEFPCGGRGHCRACRVRLISGHLQETPADRRQFSPEELARGWRLACGHRAEGPLVLELAQWETPVLAGPHSFSFHPRPGTGIAVDVGTTTLAAQLLCLESGETLAVETALNPQGRWGADLMSRIHAALYENQAEALSGAIRLAVGEMIALLREAARSHGRGDGCRQVFLAGNTVMHHLFAGIAVDPLASYPFESPHLGPARFSAGELGWRSLPDEAPVCFLPCPGGFVGSDILAGILATDLHRSPEPRMLLDLGTNGEIVLAEGRRLLCASTAAGPAFEGGRISCGMRAAAGAVDQVWRENGVFRCHVIHGVAPRGLCGSGLVDWVAAGLDAGAILPSGRLAGGERGLVLEPPVCLSQKDIRELQLAKAAIAAGVRLLLRRMGRTIEEIATVFLAGAFGNYIRPANALRLGLLPGTEERIEPAGNTALHGAIRFLFSPDPEAEWQEILRRTEHVSLADDPLFQDLYADEMMFPASR